MASLPYIVKCVWHAVGLGYGNIADEVWQNVWQYGNAYVKCMALGMASMAKCMANTLFVWQVVWQSYGTA